MSDLSPIAVCNCVGCGRGSDHVALKRLNTYSRAWGCLQCFIKYRNCANCQHERHASSRNVFAPGEFKTWSNTGRCYCGCDDYRHGLDAEWDRQYGEHVGKPVLSRPCLRGCGRYAYQKEGMPLLFCEVCEREWSNLNERRN